MNKLKKLMEKRAALMTRLSTMLAALEDGEEVRAFTDEEMAEFNETKKQAESLSATISALQEQRSAEDFAPADGEAADDEQRALAEVRSFERFLRSGGSEQMETRSDTNWTASANGAVLPTAIANKIIDKVREISPLFSLATHYNVGGTLNIPYYDESTTEITVGYADEFSELESSAGQFKSITLKNYLAGALSKISRSLINNSNFPIVDYVVGKIAEKFALWIDKELIKGTTSKIDGLSGVTQSVTTAASAAITADELMELQDTVPDVFQPNAVWIMSKYNTTELRIEQHISAINAYLNILCMQTGLSAGTFSFDVQQGMKTATEIISQESKTARTAKNNKNLLAEAIETVVHALIRLGVMSGEISQQEYSVTIGWNDNIIIDDNTLIDNNIKLVSAGLKSKVRAIMEIQKCDEATAREELARMSQEDGGDIADLFGENE